MGLEINMRYRSRLRLKPPYKRPLTLALNGQKETGPRLNHWPTIDHPI